MELIEFLVDKPKIFVPTGLENVVHAYQTSFQTERLVSEKNRTIFGETTKFEEDLRFVETLQYLAVKNLALNYKGGKLDDRWNLDNLEIFGKFLDPELPIVDLLELECDSFFKRVVKLYSKTNFQYLELEEEALWKNRALELKLTDHIENTSVVEWDLDIFHQICSAASDFIQKITINKMATLKKFEHRYVDETLENVPVEVCHHGSLEFLQALKCLKVLSVRFCPEYMGKKFKREFYENSYADIENLTRFAVLCRFYLKF